MRCAAILLFLCGAVCGQWESIPTLGDPNFGRSSHSAIVDADGRMIIFGGALQAGGMLYKSNDVYVHSFDTGSWTSYTTDADFGDTFPPSLRTGHSSIYHPPSNSMVVFGGSGNQGNLLSDLRFLQLNESFTWSIVVAGGDAVPARFGHSAVYLEADNSMLVFGGDVQDEGVFNDTWKYFFDTQEWMMVATSGSCQPRTGHSALLKSNGMMLVFGGDTNEIMQLDTATFEWTQLWVDDGLVDSPATRTFHYAALNEADELLIFGGIGPLAEVYSDLWIFNINGEWNLLDAGVGPSARNDGSSVFVDGKMIIYGGKNAGDLNFFEETWRLNSFQVAVSSSSETTSSESTAPATTTTENQAPSTTNEAESTQATSDSSESNEESDTQESSDTSTPAPTSSTTTDDSAMEKSSDGASIPLLWIAIGGGALVIIVLILIVIIVIVKVIKRKKNARTVELTLESGYF